MFGLPSCILNVLAPADQDLDLDLDLDLDVDVDVEVEVEVEVDEFYLLISTVVVSRFLKC